METRTTHEQNKTNKHTETSPERSQSNYVKQMEQMPQHRTMQNEVDGSMQSKHNRIHQRHNNNSEDAFFWEFGFKPNSMDFTTSHATPSWHSSQTSYTQNAKQNKTIYRKTNKAYTHTDNTKRRQRATLSHQTKADRNKK